MSRVAHRSFIFVLVVVGCDASRPTDPAAAGLALVARGRYDEAIPLLEKAVASRRARGLRPEDRALHHDLALASRAAGREARALDLADEMLEIDPQALRHRYLRAVIRRERQELEAAARDLEEVLEAPADVLESETIDARQAFVLLARTYDRLGRHSRMVEAARRGLERFTGDPELLLLEAGGLASDLEHEAAIGTLERLVAAHPDNSEARRLLGKVQLNAARYVEARTTLAPLVEGVREAPIDLLFDHSRALVESGSLAEGVAGLSRVLTRDPDHREALFHVGRALVRQGRRQLGTAILRFHRKLVDAAADEVLAADLVARGDRVGALYYRSLVEHRHGRLVPAYRLALEAWKLAPANSQVITRLADALDELEWLAASVDFLEKAAARPDSGTHRVALARALHAAGRPDEAIDLLETVVERAGPGLEAGAPLYWLARFLAGAGRRARLEALVEDLPAAAATLPAALYARARLVLEAPEALEPPVARLLDERAVDGLPERGEVLAVASLDAARSGSSAVLDLAEQAVERAPASVEALEALAAARRASGDAAAAGVAADAAAALVETLSRWRAGLAKRPGVALEENGDAFLRLAAALRRPGLEPAAKRFALAAADLDPGSAPSWQLVAQLHDERGEVFHRVAALTRAARVAEEPVPYQRTLAQVCALDGVCLDEARRLAEATLDKPPAHLGRYTLALVLEAQEQWSEALEAAGQAVALQPANRTYRALMERLRARRE